MPLFVSKKKIARLNAEFIAKAVGGPAGIPVNFGAVNAAANAYAAYASTPDDVAAAMVQQGMDPSQAFSPGRPINPYEGYSVDPRRFDFITGQNITSRPRGNTGRVAFETLRSITSSYDIARMCIEHRIDDVRSLKLQFRAVDGDDEDNSGDIAAGKKALVKPDGRRPFSAWLSMFLEDVLRYDAGALYRQRNNRGDVIGLKVVDGTTIAPMVDIEGDLPEGEAPAYVQFANGVPWVWLTDADLIYVPFRPQPDSVYGLPPMEWMLLTANTDLRFQWHFLQYFTDGSVPAGFAESPPDQSNPAQVKEWQDVWDAVMVGDQAKKQQIRWVPSGTKFTFTRDDPFEDVFPLYLMHKVCAAFHVVPNDLGFTEDVNRSTGDTQIDVQFRIGTMPLVQHVETILNAYLQDDLGLKVEVSFDTGQEKEDRLAEAQAWDVWVKMGAASPDEPRDKVLGLPIDPTNPTPRFIFSTRAGAIPLKSIIEISGEIDKTTYGPEEVTLIETKPGDFAAPAGVVAQPDDINAKIKAAAAAAAGKAVALVSPVVGGAQPAVAGGAPVPAEGAAGAAPPTGESAVGTDPTLVSKELENIRKWRDNSRTRVAKGQAPRMFDGLPPATTVAIWRLLGDARSREEVDAAFEAVAKGPKVLPAGPATSSTLS